MTNKGTCMIRACTWVRIHAPPLMTSQRHIQLLTFEVLSWRRRTQTTYGHFFPSLRLSDDLQTRKIKSRGMVWPNRKDIPSDLGSKKLKLKRVDIQVNVRGGLTALVWKDRWEVYILTNINPPPEGNFCHDSNCPVKPHIVEWYKLAHMLHWHFWSYGQQLFDGSTYIHVYLKTVFLPSGSNSTQQLDSVMFVWSKIYVLRFQTHAGEEFDPRSWKKSRSPHPQLGWKAKCDFNTCCEAGKMHQQTLASQDYRTLLPRKLSSWPALGYYVQV